MPLANHARSVSSPFYLRLCVLFLLCCFAVRGLAFGQDSFSDGGSVITNGDTNAGVNLGEPCLIEIIDGVLVPGSCPPDIQFSPPAGSYDSEILVTISSSYPPDTTIHYTLDGRDPSASDPIALESLPVRIDG